MPKPTRPALKERLEAAATTKKQAEAAWLALEDSNLAGDAAKADRDAAWRALKDAEELAQWAAILLTRRDQQDGVI